MKNSSRLFLAAMWLALPMAVQAQQSGQMLEIMQQLTRLEGEVRQLRGEVERLTHENARLKSRQNDVYIDLDRRIQAMESGQAPASPPADTTSTVILTPAPGTVTGPSAAALPGPAVDADTRAAATVPAPLPTTAGTAVTVDPAQEKAAYQAAHNLLKSGKYQEAIGGYQDFLKQYPNGTYAPEAQYWLGEAWYVLGNYPSALQAYQAVLDNYPQSRRIPGARLKIGYVYGDLKESDKARQALTELVQQHPGTTEAKLANNRLKLMRLEQR